MTFAWRNTTVREESCHSPGPSPVDNDGDDDEQQNHDADEDGHNDRNNTYKHVQPYTTLINRNNTNRAQENLQLKQESVAIGFPFNALARRKVCQLSLCLCCSPGKLILPVDQKGLCANSLPCILLSFSCQCCRNVPRESCGPKGSLQGDRTTTSRNCEEYFSKLPRESNRSLQAFTGTSELTGRGRDGSGQRRLASHPGEVSEAPETVHTRMFHWCQPLWK